MQVRKRFGGVVLVALVAGACGGSGATQTPAGATQAAGATQDGGGGGGGGGSTEQPAATQSGGGGGGGGGTGQYGSVTFTVSGAFDKTATFDFIPAGSMFGGSNGSALNFTDGTSDGQGSVLSILIDESGKAVVSYVGTEGQVPAAECTTSDWNVGAQNASGKFDCKAALSITASGATVQGGKITGQFTART